MNTVSSSVELCEMPLISTAPVQDSRVVTSPCAMTALDRASIFTKANFPMNRIFYSDAQREVPKGRNRLSLLYSLRIPFCAA
jgi:hypothetical protein